MRPSWMHALAYVYKYSMLTYSRNCEVGSMGIGAGFCMYDVVVSSSNEFLLNNRCESVSACIQRCKFSQFLHWGFSRSPKQLKWVLSKVECLCGGAAQMAQFSVIGIISGASRHPKDGPFVHEFWWGRTV